MFEMKDEYKTGIESIDEQHKMLFEIAERTYQLLKNNYTIDKYDSVVELLNELKDYTVFHFREEEEYMKSINYKRMFTQKIEHDQFIKKLNDIDISKIDENQDQYILSILELINKWLVEHILEKDLLISK